MSSHWAWVVQYTYSPGINKLNMINGNSPVFLSSIMDGDSISRARCGYHLKIPSAKVCTVLQWPVEVVGVNGIY